MPIPCRRTTPLRKPLASGAVLCFLVLLTLITGTSCQQQASADESRSTGNEAVVEVPAMEVAHEQLKLLPAKGEWHYQNAPYNGWSVRATSPAKPTVERAGFVNGKRHGLLERWYPDGTLAYSANYVHGKLHGLTKSWWSNGNQRSQSTFVNGVAHGTHNEWYTSGKPFKEMHVVHGQEKGMQRAWRENGKLYCNYEARDGRTFGLKRGKLCFQLNDETVQHNR